MHIVENARQVISGLDIEPITKPIRGGTDGAQISFRGLPTPNLFTGSVNAHGPYEYIPVESMQQAVRVILGIIARYAEGQKK